MSNKQFTHDDLQKAIDFALKHSNGELDKAEAKRDVTGVLYSMFINLDSLWVDLKTPEDKLQFMETYVKSLYETYAGKCKEIELVRSMESSKRLEESLKNWGV